MKRQRSVLLKISVSLAAASLVLAGCSSSGGSSSADAAESYPNKPIRFLVPFAAGGPSSLTSLSYAACLEKTLGKPVVVENMPGASGGVAMQDLAGEKADGYTLGLSTYGPVIVNPLMNDLAYSLEDFSPIGVMAKFAHVLVVSKDSPYRTVEDFLTAAKENPGKLSVAVPGLTTGIAIELQRLKDNYGIDVTPVPAAGNAEMTTNLLGGHVDALFITDHTDVEARIKDGSFKALAISSPERAKGYEDVPTLAESGYPELIDAVSIFGVVGPAGMPEGVVEKLDGGLKACSEDPEVIAQIGERFVPDEYDGAAVLNASFVKTQELYESILGK